MIIRNKFNGYVGGTNRLYPGGGGGGQPTNTTQTTTTIPEYARPYVERMLGKAEAFSETPYQAYGGQRTAGFTPMQEQAFQGAANLGPAKQLGTGTQLAGIAGLGGLGAGQQYAQQATNPYAMQSYMSPYIQNALEPQMQEAARRSAIQGQQNQAQAAQQGAFGGSRTAIVEAERQRNLGQQQADIYGRGMQTAFEQARQAQQFGADLGLRGYGMAGQMAGTSGSVGSDSVRPATRCNPSAGSSRCATTSARTTRTQSSLPRLPVTARLPTTAVVIYVGYLARCATRSTDSGSVSGSASDGIPACAIGSGCVRRLADDEERWRHH
jgi:hypothetical protein